MPEAPKAPTAKAVNTTTEKDGIKILKTFIWSAKVKDRNLTFLKDDTLVGFPSSEVVKFEKAGFLLLPKKD